MVDGRHLNGVWRGTARGAGAITLQGGVFGKREVHLTYQAPKTVAEHFLPEGFLEFLKVFYCQGCNKKNR
jgi:hypothetical protein